VTTHPTITCCVLALAAALCGQTPTPDPAPRTPALQQAPPGLQASTALHEAWLREVLDLDVQGAVTGYRTLAEQAPAGAPERWVAVARLAELHRLGVEGSDAGDFTHAPQEVREAVAGLDQPLPIPDLLHLARHEPGARLPALHPATPLIVDWVRNEFGSNVGDRLRRQANRVRRSTTNRNPERWYAFDILQVELRGRAAQAQALRTLYFTDWRPPAIDDDAEQQLAAVRQRLQAWLDDEETASHDRALLRQLGAAIDERETDPRGALLFLARMPRYAERLMLPQPGETTPGETTSDKSTSESTPGGQERPGR